MRSGSPFYCGDTVQKDKSVPIFSSPQRSTSLIELAEWSTVISLIVIATVSLVNRRTENPHNMSDVFRRIGRGGAGNFIPEKEIQEAARAKEAQVSHHLCAPPMSVID